MRKRTLLTVLCSITLLLCMTFPTALAAGKPSTSNPRVRPALINCITITNTGRTVDELTAHFSGYVQNYTCDSSVTGTLYVHGDIRCSGAKSVNLPDPESLPVPIGDEVAWSSNVDGFCVVCTDGVVTSAPSFFLDVYASYVGKDHSNMSVGGTSPTRSILLSNDSGLVGTPC
jgi:hypothetical protein